MLCVLPWLLLLFAIVHLMIVQSHLMELRATIRDWIAESKKGLGDTKKLDQATETLRRKSGVNDGDGGSG